MEQLLTQAQAAGMDTHSGGFNIIHIHPTYQCNLRCSHCYSMSSPAYKKGIDKTYIKDFIKAMKPFGYDVLSFSGGEPFMYESLEETLAYGREQGFKIAVASNGTLFRSKRVQALFKYIDLVSVSIDGPKHIHDVIRNMPGAYERSLEGIDILQNSGMRFGVIHAATPDTWEYLPELAQMAYEKGASLFQIHPIEMTGRALHQLPDLQLYEDLLHKIYIVGNVLKQQYAGLMQVQVDLLHREHVKDYPHLTDLPANWNAATPISNLLHTLVMKPDGDVIPFQFDFSNTYKIFNIQQTPPDSYANALQRYMLLQGVQLYNVIKNAREKYLSSPGYDVFNWNEYLVQQSRLS